MSEIAKIEKWYLFFPFFSKLSKLGNSVAAFLRSPCFACPRLLSCAHSDFYFPVFPLFLLANNLSVDTPFANAVCAPNKLREIMVLLHLARCARYAIRGFLTKEKGVFDETVVNLYAGVRYVDGFGHMNNAKYLEVMEFARWFEAGQKRWFSKMKAAGMYPVVAAAHIQFLREVPPACIVQVRSRYVSCEGKSIVIRQHMLDRTGKKLHATALFRISMIDTRRRRASPTESAAGDTKATSPPSKEEGNASSPSRKQKVSQSAVLSADEFIRRMGFEPDAVRQQLLAYWLQDLGLTEADARAKAASSSQKAKESTIATQSPLDANSSKFRKLKDANGNVNLEAAAASIAEAAIRVLDDVNDLDDKWRRVARAVERHSYMDGGAGKIQRQEE